MVMMLTIVPGFMFHLHPLGSSFLLVSAGWLRKQSLKVEGTYTSLILTFIRTFVAKKNISFYHKWKGKY